MPPRPFSPSPAPSVKAGQEYVPGWEQATLLARPAFGGDRRPSIFPSLEQQQQRSTGIPWPTHYGESQPFGTAQKELEAEEAVEWPTEPNAGPTKGKKGLSQLMSTLSAGQLLHQLVSFLGGAVLAWIPGIVAITLCHALSYPQFAFPTVLGVGLFWWSAWLSVAWAAAWLCWATAVVAPSLLKVLATYLVAPLQQQVKYLTILRRNVSICLWFLLVWITFLSIVYSHLSIPITATSGTLVGNNTTATNSTAWIATSASDATFDALDQSIQKQALVQLSNSASNEEWLITCSKFLFGLLICSVLLLAEKWAIQSIAHGFHLVTYADRIRQVRYEAQVLTTLLRFADQRDRQVRRGLVEEHQKTFNLSRIPSLAQRTAYPSCPDEWTRFRAMVDLPTNGAQDTDVTSPFPTASTLLQPSDEAIVEACLESSERTRLLAKVLFAALAQTGPSATLPHHQGERCIILASFQPCFPTATEAKRAFQLFTPSEGHDDCTWSEWFDACLSMHERRLCLFASLFDVDAAVAKLDHILYGVWLTASCILLAALLSSRISTLLASLGTLLLGLSWLLSSTAQEALSSVVWVFGKHPIDVGDQVVIPGLLSTASSNVTKDTLAALEGYTDGDTLQVIEVQLLSTIFRTSLTGKHVQVGNAVLSQKAIVNLRRSGAIDEPFTVRVAYRTPLAALTRARQRMVEWLAEQRGAYRTGLDVAVEGMDDQTALTLTTMIRYSSHWQDARVRLRRRNDWILAWKQCLDLEAIGGPAHAEQGEDHAGAPTVGIQSFTLMDQVNGEADAFVESLEREHNIVGQV